jgi:hypothetical protein
VVADPQMDEFMNDDLGSTIGRLGKKPDIEREPAT